MEMRLELFQVVDGAFAMGGGDNKVAVLSELGCK